MNLTWHIIRKDLGRFKWLLAVWAALGIYAVAYARIDQLGRGEGDVVGIFAILAFIGLSLSLIAWIIQEDEVTQPGVFWRTRPISPGRLLLAKLSLIGFLMVLLPTFGISIARPRGFGLEIVSFLATATLLCAAVAASVKDLGRYFLIGFLGFMLFGEFARRIFKLGLQGFRITDDRGYLLEALCIMTAILVLVNQYRGRGVARSIVIVVAAISGALTLLVVWWQTRG